MIPLFPTKKVSIFFSALLIPFLIFSQQNKYAAEIIPVITSQSPFIIDYIKTGSSEFETIIHFYDFNEQSWDCRFQFSFIKSDGSFSLLTRPEFIPQNPVSVFPGQSLTISGADFAEYFQKRNLIISGAQRSVFLKESRLPEGNYQICFEVLDYFTGNKISEEVCIQHSFELMNPPILTKPINKSFVDPSFNQIDFEWESFAGMDIDESSYNFYLWEIPFQSQQPETEVNNGNIVLVQEVNNIYSNNFILDGTGPLLENGKTYVWQIKANPESSYKNNGCSQFYYFNYGWPLNGNIKLLEPHDNHVFKKSSVAKLKWDRPNNLLEDQWVNYLVEVYENSNQDEINRPFHSRKTATYFSHEFALDTLSKLKPMMDYLWKVYAFTDELEVANSKSGNFKGPLLMEKFYAGKHAVVVEELSNADLDNIAGKGKIKVSKDEDKWIDVEFNNLTLSRTGSIYALIKGEILIPFEKTYQISPKDSANLTASFYSNNLILKPEGLSIAGSFETQLRLVADSQEIPKLKNEKVVLNYDDFELFGGFQVNELSLNLLEPGTTIFNINSGSFIYVNNDSYSMQLRGSVVFSGLFKSSTFFFQSLLQPYFFTLDMDNGLKNELVQNTGIFISPLNVTIDLSKKINPKSIENAKEWKGIVFNKYIISFESSGNKKSPVQYIDSTIFELSTGDLNYFYFDSNSYNYQLTLNDLSLKSSVYEFNSSVKSINITSSKGEISDSSNLESYFLIPFLDQEKKFECNFSVNRMGFQFSEIRNLKKEYAYNKSSEEQFIELEILEYYLSKSRIDFLIILNWPYFGINNYQLKNFTIWSDHHIGFATKNGTIGLNESLKTEIEDYPANGIYIAAGSSNGYYNLAISFEMILGDDVSGENGAPLFNIYSRIPNDFAIQDSSFSNTVYHESTDLIELANKKSQEFEELENNLLKNLESSENSLSKELHQIESEENSQAYTVHEIINQTSEEPFNEQKEIDFVSDNIDKEKLNKVIQEFSIELTNQLMFPVDKKIDSLRKDINLHLHYAINKGIEKGEFVLDEILDAITNSIIKALQNDKVDISPFINSSKTSVKNKLMNEIEISVRGSAEKNVVQPLSRVLSESLTVSISTHIQDNIYLMFINLLTKNNEEANNAFIQLTTGFPEVVKESLTKTASSINQEMLESTIKSFVEDAISNIDLIRVKDNMIKEVKDHLKSRVNEMLNEELQDQLSENIIISGLNDSPIDFVNIGDRALKGDLLSDPIYVNVESPMVKVSGYLSLTKNHEKYGNIWLGNVNGVLSIPEKFAFNAAYMIGRVKKLPYWFIELRPGTADLEEPEIGKPLSNEVSILENPTKVGSLKLVGAAGRAFHNMATTSTNSIEPTKENKYGAFMNLVFFDHKKDGKLTRLQLKGDININKYADYTLNLLGEAQIQNENFTVLESDVNAPIQGNAEISYNSAERHFIGDAFVTVNKPNVLCAEGRLLFDIKPGHWDLKIGSRQNRIVFVPNCQGWSPTGWLFLNTTGAELGLGVQWNLNHEFPSEGSIPVAAWRTKFQINAGIAFGVNAAVEYDPLTLTKAGIWADVWANLLMKYKLFTANSWNNITLLDVLLKGDLILYFEPKPTYLEGTLSGYVSLLFFKKEINTAFRKEI